MSEYIDAPKSMAYIVASALLRIGGEGDKMIERFTVIANEYYSEKLNMLYLPNIAVKYYDASSTNLFTLPNDFVDYLKVGMELNGEMWTLGLNEHLVLPRKEACGERIPTSTNAVSIPSGGYAFADHYRNGSLVTGMLGRGGGWNVGYFNIDREERLLSIDGSLPKNELILEYTSSGVKKDGTSMVPLEAVNCVRQHLILEHYARNVKEYGSLIGLQMQALRDAENLLDRYVSTPTLDEVLDAFYESYKQGAKR